jgi:hypothetical protein
MPDYVQLDLVDTEVVLEVIGEVGPRGPAGTSSGFFRHNQASASAQWTFVHDLNYPPAVTVVDSAGSQVFGDVTYVDESTIQIDFAFPFAGYAYCS